MRPTHPTVLFNLKPGVPAERRRGVLADVAAWPAIKGAGPLLPDSPVESLRRACVATLRQPADAPAVVERLKALQEVESVSTPVPRRLVA